METGGQRKKKPFFLVSMQLDMNIKETTDCFFLGPRRNRCKSVAHCRHGDIPGIVLIFLFEKKKRIDSCLYACV